MLPLLSVCIRSFNQERYIAEAISSVLQQRTNFEFEIIVSDDCSSDNTSEIERSFQNKNPNIIRLLLGDNNIGGPKNLRRVIESSRAKYLAFLDGDDYFTDVYKLQKQVDYLEAHDEYVACFHNVINLDEKTGKRSLFLPLDFQEYHDCISVISNDWFLPIHSIVLRRELVFFPEWYDSVMNDDFVMNLSVVMHGPYHYISDVMAVYRHHDSNISNSYKNQILIDSQLREILLGFKSIYPAQYRGVFENRIQYYSDRIAFNERESKHPWRKYFRIKTYKRLLKRMLLSII